ncbi:glycosyltransferase family 2 protein, partial [Salmonella enterica subsp. enterica serovar Johannesburg]|nr:glycosyltransferase family 2 protein [Salmonella enterica subsp. enterica serovar Johannesburg]
ESIINNYTFLKRYNAEINNLTNDNHTIFYRQFLFIYSKFIAFGRKLIK